MGVGKTSLPEIMNADGRLSRYHQISAEEKEASKSRKKLST